MWILLLFLVPYPGCASYYCNIHVVIEDGLYAMWNRDSGIAKTTVTSIISNLNRIYTDTVFQEMGLLFQVAKITIAPDICAGPTTSEHSKACLTKFSQNTNSTEHCLNYLFTYRDFSGGQVGSAWPGYVCLDQEFAKLSLNTGLVSFLNFEQNQTLTMVSENLAHEIGHNFGAIHDEITEHCNTSGFLMGQSGTSLLTKDTLEGRSFSSCSERCIKQDLEAIFQSKKGNPHEACKSGPGSEKRYRPLAHKKKLCFTTEKISSSKILLHNTKTSGVLWGLVWSFVTLLCFLVLLCCCLYARSPVKPTTHMGRYLERFSAESGANASLLMTRMSANASVGLTRLEVRTKDNLDKISNLSRDNIGNMSVRAREQIGSVSDSIRRNVSSLRVKTRDNFDDVKESYFERDSARSNQSQMSTVTLDSFDDPDDSSEAFLNNQEENVTKVKFVKAAKREVDRADIELVHNQDLVMKTDMKVFTPIVL
eukprot:GFUD01009616.1.p1 GENE.GFUD01009616.1~~GFUD01009616.1.p1  ORF type:complete len:480 (+),score=109.95 GFUD01009616.1:684-2123(+)